VYSENLRERFYDLIDIQDWPVNARIKEVNGICHKVC
jgi:hypothetical protein